jgi:broad specificity phosphatase PhoE
MVCSGSWPSSIYCQIKYEERVVNTFYIVRHGETENNKTGRLSGWVDTPLTEKGLEPTKRVIAKLADLRIDEIYSSDLGRAFVTAYVVARNLKFTKEIHRLPGLREVNYGDAANMFSVEAYKKYLGLDQDTYYTPPNGESLDHMQQRVLTTISELNKKHTDATIVLVCHSGTMVALQASYLGQVLASAILANSTRTITLLSSW